MRYPVVNTSVGVVSAAAVVGATLWILWSWRKKKSLPTLRAGTVSNLFLYPVKSTQGVTLEEALCTPVGLQKPGTDIKDRKYVITSSDYTFITMRQEPSLALVKISVPGNDVHLEAPNMDKLIIRREATGQDRTVKIFNQPVSAVDCGEEASQWLSAFLKREGVRLCRDTSGPESRFVREVKNEPLKTFLQKAKKEDQAVFSDVAPFMVLSDASLEDLNSRMDVSLSVRSFRPNITISGCPPFDEDTWTEMKIGEAHFRFVINCSRCILTQVNPDTGTRRQDEEPLKTLRKYRLIDPAFENSPCFGTHWVLEKPGVIKVGDPVYVSKA